jgi:N-acetylglutamate synthase-like GNAT family acetyltransferase
VIRRCAAGDVQEILGVINDAATAYRGVIPAERWKEPYMPLGELREEIAAGVQFWAWVQDSRIAGVMGLQLVGDVALIRHAYTRPADQGKGIGSALLLHLVSQADRPVLVGTWKAATWAIRFYLGRDFILVSEQEKAHLLRRYWTVSERQIEESVVLRLNARRAASPSR